MHAIYIYLHGLYKLCMVQVTGTVTVNQSCLEQVQLMSTEFMLTDIAAFINLLFICHQVVFSVYLLKKCACASVERTRTHARPQLPQIDSESVGNTAAFL